VSREPLVSRTRGLGATGGERGYWPLWVGELQDAVAGGSSESVSAVGYMSSISMVEVWVVGELQDAVVGAGPLMPMNS